MSDGWRVEVEMESDDTEEEEGELTIAVFSEYMDAVRSALDNRTADCTISICRGPGRCSPEDNQKGPCEFCFVIDGEDDRSTEDLLRVLRSGH